jgi:hypothetical protein
VKVPRHGEDTVEKFIQPKRVWIGKVAQKQKRCVPASRLERILDHQLAQAIDDLIPFANLARAMTT